MRIPEVCNWDPSTTVLAHIRRSGGIGIKPPDVCGVFACSKCHDVMDRRALFDGGYLILQSYILDGHLRTLRWWVENGYL